MSTGTLSPDPWLTVLDANGNPVSGALVHTYLAGTTTPTATYTDVNLTIANANPIVADSAGRYLAFLTPGASYKFVIQNPDSSSIRTQDNISAVPASSANFDIIGIAGETLTAAQVVYLSSGNGGLNAGQWYRADNSQAFSSTLPPIGMTVAAIASGASGAIRLGGVEPGLSSLTVGTVYYVGTLGALTAAPTTNARIVGVADTTNSIVIAPNARIADLSAIVQTTSTGSQNDFAPGLSGDTLLICNNASLLTITGFAGGVQGQRIVMVSIGAGQVDLVNASGSSASGNRLLNYASSGPTSLAAGVGYAEYVYDTSSRWRLLNHHQGDFITWGPTFSTSSAATWTGIVNSSSRYLLCDRQMTVIYEFTGSTVSATSASELRFSLPSTFTASGRMQGIVRAIDNGGTATAAMAICSNTDAFVRLYKDMGESGSWTASTANTSAAGTLLVNIA